MRTVTRDEILGLGAYEEVHNRFRARMIAHKKSRRVFVGDDVAMVFEDHDTVLLQVQEMMRAERISAPDAVLAEIDVYNDLVAPDGALVNLRENAPFCRPERGAAPVRRVHYKRQRRASAHRSDRVAATPRAGRRAGSPARGISSFPAARRAYSRKG